MRLFVDKNLSHRLGPLLQAAGHDVVHVDDVGLGSASDRAIVAFAREDDRVVVSSDTDFGTLLAAEGFTRPSVVLTRDVATLPTADLAAVLVANLAEVEEDLDAGAIVAVGESRLRVRRLPLR